MTNNVFLFNDGWPDIEGRSLQEMICLEMYFKGQLEELANVIFLKIGGDWLKLYFDGDVIFWRIAKAPPEASERLEHDSYFKLKDVADKFSFKGDVIERLEARLLENGVEVLFSFNSGKSIVFSNLNDLSNYRTAMEEG